MSEIGESAGYVVLILDRHYPDIWNETPSGVFETIGHAAGMVDTYEEQQKFADQKDTYAVARLDLVMISRK